MRRQKGKEGQRDGETKINKASEEEIEWRMKKKKKFCYRARVPFPSLKGQIDDRILSAKYKEERLLPSGRVK